MGVRAASSKATRHHGFSYPRSGPSKSGCARGTSWSFPSRGKPHGSAPPGGRSRAPASSPPRPPEGRASPSGCRRLPRRPTAYRKRRSAPPPPSQSAAKPPTATVPQGGQAAPAPTPASLTSQARPLLPRAGPQPPPRRAGLGRAATRSTRNALSHPAATTAALDG